MSQGGGGLGNAWHTPNSREPRTNNGMRTPVGPIVPGIVVTITAGNKYKGDDNPGNQLQDGSQVFFRRRPRHGHADKSWTASPMVLLPDRVDSGDNRYSSAKIALDEPAHEVGDTIQYYIRIAYEGHATTFLQAKGDGSKTTKDESAAQDHPFSFTLENPNRWGRWGPLTSLGNTVPIHTHLLPTGQLLMWGRRDRPDQTLDEHECTPFLWNPDKPTAPMVATPQPRAPTGETINLFCAGHAFLPDGRLLVAGGHLKDGFGIPQACIYDPIKKTWAPTENMNNGRWYPTVVTLPDGSSLSVSGSYQEGSNAVNNFKTQLWQNGKWSSVVDFPDSFELYPRMHVASDGDIAMVGPLAKTWKLDIKEKSWTPIVSRAQARRDYACSVMYDVDKIVYIGGGNDAVTKRPTAEAEYIDLNKKPWGWKSAGHMKFPRRQHNATILPDGTIFVSGGTRGPGFNDVSTDGPVHTSELWDPTTKKWAELAAEQADRCYHAVTLLLPDGTVFSGGGGEYRPDDSIDVPNLPEDTHRNYQIYYPPYLFKGPRPTIISLTGETPGCITPYSMRYRNTFKVETENPRHIGKVSAISLASVTHSINFHQRINFFKFEVVDNKHLLVTAPESPNVCTPGHYVMYLVDKNGVPSVGKFIEIPLDDPPTLHEGTRRILGTTRVENIVPSRDHALATPMRAPVVHRGIKVTVGITSTCPYGLGACWGGAHEALINVDSVVSVDRVPNLQDSTATIYLQDQGLPQLAKISEQFTSVVNGSYEIRGFEVTISGCLKSQGGSLCLQHRFGDKTEDVVLTHLDAGKKVQRRRSHVTPHGSDGLSHAEIGAFKNLENACGSASDLNVSVTGTISCVGDHYELAVRHFEPNAA